MLTVRFFLYLIIGVLCTINNDRSAYTYRRGRTAADVHCATLDGQRGLDYRVRPTAVPVQMGQRPETGRLLELEPHQHTHEPEHGGTGARHVVQHRTGAAKERFHVLEPGQPS